MSRRQAVRRADRIEPTPETLAKLQQPVSRSWGPEFEAAEIQIAEAVTLIAGHQMMRAADYGYVIKSAASPDHTPRQRQVIWRYKIWLDHLRHDSIHIAAIIGIIALGEPVKWKEGLLKTALKKYIDLQKRRG